MIEFIERRPWLRNTMLILALTSLLIVAVEAYFH